jgi:transcriptional repressor NrdR
MTNVSKRDGRTEEFMPEKIVVSAVKSGASPEAAREIAGEVEQNAGGTINTREIRDRVLDGLGRRNPEWRRNWEVYDQAVKRRS